MDLFKGIFADLSLFYIASDISRDIRHRNIQPSAVHVISFLPLAVKAAAVHISPMFTFPSSLPV